MYKFALRFPHTFYVLAILIIFLGGTAILTTSKDIFPQINIPVVTVIWQYTGLSPKEMEVRVATYSEYSISSSVTGIRNMESQTLEGIVVQRVYFQPGVNIELGDRADRLGHELDPSADADGHPAAHRRSIQCVERAGAAAQPVLRYARTSSSFTIMRSTACGRRWRRSPA